MNRNCCDYVQVETKKMDSLCAQVKAANRVFINEISSKARLGSGNVCASRKDYALTAVGLNGINYYATRGTKLRIGSVHRHGSSQTRHIY